MNNTNESSFPFVNLPPEVRNRIYDLAVESQDGEVTRVLPCLSLALVSRALRWEYRALCLKQAVVIECEDVNNYLSVFYPTTPATGAIANLAVAPSAITIRVPSLFEAPISRRSPPDLSIPTQRLRMDILPIIKMGMANPSFVFEFEPRNTSGHPVITQHTLAHCRLVRALVRYRNLEWVTAVANNRVTKVIVYSCAGVATFKPGFRVYLDQDRVPLERQFHNPQAVLFLKRVGLWRG